MTANSADAATGPKRESNADDPLGLPPGSVRAIITLTLVGFVIAQLLRGVELRVVWTETLMIVLAHYFTSRRLVNLTAEQRQRLQAEGVIPIEDHPLFLPRHSIRLLIVGGFGALAWKLYQDNRLMEPQAMSVLAAVGAYLLGMLTSAIWRWLTRNSKRKEPRWWIDFKALLTLVVVGATIATEFIAMPEWFPLERKQMEDSTLALILFYFGSR